MAAHRSAHAPEQEQAGEHPPISPRTLAHARAARRRVLSHQTLRDRWENPFDVPMGAREVFRAASQLVVIDGDGLEYRPDLEVGGPQTLVQRLTRRAKVLGAELEVAEHLRTLVWMQLLRLTEEGALRLGVDCRPKARMRAPGAALAVKPVSERKRAANIANSRSRWNKEPPEGQGTILMPLAGGLAGSAASSEGTARAPQQGGSVGPKVGPTDDVSVGHTEVAIGSNGGSPTSSERRAPRLSSSSLAAAAPMEDSIDSSVCTAAAAAKEADQPVVQKPRASSGAHATEEPTFGPTDDATVHLLALDVGTILKIDGRRGSPGAVLVATWLSLGLPRDTILSVARRRMAANEEKVHRGLAAPIGSFDFLNDAMYEAAGREPPSRTQQAAPAPVSATPLAAAAGEHQQTPSGFGRLDAAAARIRRNTLSEKGRAWLAKATHAADTGDEPLLMTCLAHMHSFEGRALTVLLDEQPQARELFERMRRAG